MSYKTQCSTRINFRSFTFSSLCEWFIKTYLMENLNQFYLQMILVLFLTILILKVLKWHKNLIWIHKWFKTNTLSLNFDKNHYMQFTTKNSPQIDLDISHVNKLISKAYDMKKFLGIYVDIILSGKIHFEQMLVMIKCNLLCKEIS